MTMYQPTIPTGLVNLDVDYQNIQNNFSQLDTTYGVDHVKYSLAPNNGYHKDIHQIPQAAPAPVGGINQLFAQSITPDTTGGVSDTQLFSLTGLGGLSQLTGNFSTTEGYQWIGGVLIQWGRITQVFPASQTSGTVTFKDRAVGLIPFPTDCFVVIPLATHLTADTPNGAAGVTVNSQTLTRLKFDWTFNSNSDKYRGFFWVAIGN